MSSMEDEEEEESCSEEECDEEELLLCHHDDDNEDEDCAVSSNYLAALPLTDEMLLSLRPSSSLDDDDGTAAEEVHFMILDVSAQRKKSGDRFMNGTEVFLYGRGARGESVCAIVEDGWLPYLYVKAPVGCREAHIRDPRKTERLREQLEGSLREYFASSMQQPKKKKGRRRVDDEYIMSIVGSRQKSIMGYSADDPELFLRIEVAYPFVVRALHDVFAGYHRKDTNERVEGVRVSLEEEEVLLLATGSGETFNANLDGVIQFMVDAGMVGCQWCSVRKTSSVDEGARSTCCDLEMRVALDEVRFLEDRRGQEIAPLRILSFDIEAAGRRGVFPQAEVDPVIQIGIHFHVFGAASSSSPLPILLSLKSCDSIDGGVRVLSFEDEGELLLSFCEIVKAFDVDVFTGYNVCGFDFGYLKNRAEQLGVGKGGFDLMTRSVKGSLRIRETEFFSAQMGKQRRVKVSVEGRAVMDMLLAIRNNQSYRLERYTLDAVSKYFLGDQKKDVHFTQITPMWQKDSASRKELGEYCLHDAKLPIDLMMKLDTLMQTIAMARAVGIPFDFVMQRGQMIRNASLLLRRAKVRGFVFPSRKSSTSTTAMDTKGKKKFQGATVLEPQCGLFQNVGVVDFSAMYPSIIRAHNICASTIVLDKSHPYYHQRSEEEDRRLGLTRILGHVFVPEEGHIKGLLPEVLEVLQQCRDRAKKVLAQETDPLKRKAAKADELAYKVAANGAYGAMGSELSLMFLMALAASVTALGRRDIRTVMDTAKRMFPKALLVYGDTDSLFIRHAIEDAAATTMDAVTEASRRTILLAEAVNAEMKHPKQLAFEKVYGTLLLLSKKCYCGLLYAPNHKWGEDPPIDIKGLQCQRRDGCPLVRDLLRECLTSILHTGSATDAAAMVRRRLLDIVEDRLPLEAYAIQKTLRKGIQDISHPMEPHELAAIRQQLPCGSLDADSKKQLSYAEQDEALRLGIRLPWNIKLRLPHVLLAYRLRQADAGAAPVNGDIIRYIVTSHGAGNKGMKLWEKVETLEAVRSKLLVVDRDYYIQSLKNPIMNLFLPIIVQQQQEEDEEEQQQQVAKSKGKKRKATDNERALRVAEEMLFSSIKNKAMKHESSVRRARMEQSPIAMAFAKQRMKPPPPPP